MPRLPVTEVVTQFTVPGAQAAAAPVSDPYPLRSGWAHKKLAAGRQAAGSSVMIFAGVDDRSGTGAAGSNRRLKGRTELPGGVGELSSRRATAGRAPPS